MLCPFEHQVCGKKHEWAQRQEHGDHVARELCGVSQGAEDLVRFDAQDCQQSVEAGVCH